MVLILFVVVVGTLLACSRPRKPQRVHTPPPHYNMPYRSNSRSCFMVVAWRELWMGDWDLVDDPIHAPKSCTVTHRNQVIDWLKQWCLSHPADHFVVYETPGGVRAFLVSRPLPVGTESSQMHLHLHVDPLYRNYTREKAGYACRVSPKQGRAGDYVARRWCEIGSGSWHPSCRWWVDTHDVICEVYK